MAKIAAAVERALAHRAVHGSSGGQTAQLLGRGPGWTVHDVICTCGPSDHPFEEQHSAVSIAIVVAGTFQYSADAKVGPQSALMTPGAVLLGSPGQYFECEHTHGSGDRCIAFHYSPEYFETLAREAGVAQRNAPFGCLRLPPVRPLSRVAAAAASGLSGWPAIDWEELSIELAGRALEAAEGGTRRHLEPSDRAVSRVAETVRAIERDPGAELTLDRLAQAAGMTPFHFLRTFVRVTGVTPHQYVLRTRLREAAIRLATEPGRVLDVAFDCGFGDLSNFNRAFRTEFGVAPATFRQPPRPPTAGARAPRMVDWSPATGRTAP